MHISDRSLQAKLTQKAKITFACFLPEVIFAFGGFINDLTRRQHQPPGAFVGHSTGESSMGTLCPPLLGEDKAHGRCARAARPCR